MLWLLACTDAPPPPAPAPTPAVHLDAELGEVKRVKRGKATVEAVSTAVPSELAGHFASRYGKYVPDGPPVVENPVMVRDEPAAKKPKRR